MDINSSQQSKESQQSAIDSQQSKESQQSAIDSQQSEAPDNTIEIETVVVDDIPSLPETDTSIKETEIADKPKISLDLEDYRLFSQTLWNIPGAVLESHPYLTDEEVEPFVLPFYKFCQRHPEIDIVALFPDLMFVGASARMVYLISTKHNKYMERKKHENTDDKKDIPTDNIKDKENRFMVNKPSSGK